MTLIEKLKTTPIGGIVEVKSGVKVRVYPYYSSNGGVCNKCLFREEDQGAKECPYSLACMGHHREDKESVVFKQV